MKMGSSHIHDGELPAILKPLRIGGLTNCKRKVLVVTNYTSDNSEIQRTRAPVRTLTVFQVFFARPRSSLNTIFESITNKAKQVELLMLCRVFP